MHSDQLQFTRDGRTLVVADPDTLTILDLVRDERRQVPIAAQSIAVFDDEIWIVTRGSVLVRLARDGRQLDETPLPIDPEGRLVATPIGPAAAYWIAREPMVVVEDLGTLSTRPLAEGDVIPVSGRRHARYAGSRLTLPDSSVVTLGARITGGSVVLDGTAIALVSGREIAVYGIGGRLLQRMALPPGPVRIAARRAIAIVQEGPRRLVALDLKFGVPIRTIVPGDDVIDVAIDPDGKLLALRLACGQLELAPLNEHATRKQPVQIVEAAPVPVIEEPSEAAPAATETPRCSDDAIAAAAAAFEPRPLRDPRPRAEVLDVLEQALRGVKLWTWCAIADAWSSRRLGFGNEGSHPYEHEVAALVGVNRGFAREQVAAAEAALEAYEAVPASSPLAALAEELGLSPASVDVLLVIAAPALDAHVARLYGIVCNDPGRPLVDEALVAQILERRMNRHDVAAELHPRSTLVQLGIVVCDDRPRPFAGLEVDPVIIARLRAEPIDLGAAVTAHRADTMIEALEIPPTVLATAVAALARAMHPLRLAVHGRAGSGRRTLLAAFAQQAARDLAVIDATLLPRDPDRFALALRAALRRAHLAGMLPVIRSLDGRDVAEPAREALLLHQGPLAVISAPEDHAPFAREHVRIDLPACSETERLAVWQRAIERDRLWLRDPDGLAARYRVGPGTIRRAVASVVGHDPRSPCDDAIETFLRQHRDRRLGAHARKVERLASWSDLVLPSDVMDSLRELVGRVRHRRTVYETWGMGRKLLTSRGLTALFQGQPGTGKTLVAGVIARELGLDLYQVELSKVMSKWIGETERNLASIFDAAEDGQVIILFDEADSLFAKRTDIRSSNDRYANLEVNYLLQRIDSFDGIAILTTNNSGSIDPAFKRRLSFRLSFPFPDEETRLALWRAHLPPELPRGGELTFDVLARKYQLSGGYIRNACLRAAFLAAQEEAALQQTHLERAVALEFAELGKLTTSGAVS